MAHRIIYPTERPSVELRQLVPADALAYFEAVDTNREHLSQYDDPTSRNYPDLESVRGSIYDPPVPTKLRLGIWDRDTFVGSINLKPIKDEVKDKVELGYWLDERYTGHGYATLAVKALATKSPRYTELFALIHPDNTASKNVVERSGFHIGGRSATADYYSYHHPERLADQEPVLYAQTIEQDVSHSVARIGLRGLNAAIINYASDTTYEVEYGYGQMIVGGINHVLSEGTTVSVPAGTPYQDRGHVVMLTTSRPAFNPTAIEQLDRNLLELS
jgi:RimJ/RimL family protein N-acetyltransferase